MPRISWTGHAPGKPDGVRITLCCSRIECRPTWEAEAQQAGHLVERFTGGIVDRRAQLHDGRTEVVDVQQVCVPARHQQRHTGRHRAVFEGVDRNVTAEVVHRVQRHIPRSRIGFRCRNPDEQRTGKSRADGHRHGIGHSDVCRRERAPHGRDDGLQMCAGGDFGDHSPISGMLIDTGGHLIGQQCGRTVGIPPDDSHTCFVTGTLDTQDDHGRPPSGGADLCSRRIVYASAPLGW